MAAPKAAETAAPIHFTGPAGHVKDRIIVHDSSDPNQTNRVALNGYGYLFQYGKEIDMPRPVVDHMKSLIYTVFERDENNEERKRDVQRFNLTIVKRNVGVSDGSEVAA